MSPADSTSASAKTWRDLSLLAQGYLYKEIAETMNLSLPTVNTYIRRIYEKLHVQCRGQAVAVYANLLEKKD